MTGSNLLEKLYDEEKDYLIKSAELKFQWLDLSDRIEDFVGTFHEKSLMKKMHVRSNTMATQSIDYRDDIKTVLEKAVKISQDKIDLQLLCMRKQNVKISKPNKLYDYRSGTYSIKWVPDTDTNTYAQKLDLLNQNYQKKNSEVSVQDRLSEVEQKNNLIDQKLQQQKMLKNEFFEMIVKKLNNIAHCYFQDA